MKSVLDLLLNAYTTTDSSCFSRYPMGFFSDPKVKFRVLSSITSRKYGKLQNG